MASIYFLFTFAEVIDRHLRSAAQQSLFQFFFCGNNTNTEMDINNGIRFLYLNK